MPQMKRLNHPTKYLQGRGQLPAGAIPLAEECGLICWHPSGWVKTWTLQPIQSLPPDTLKPVMAIIAEQLGTSANIAATISDNRKFYSVRTVESWRCGKAQPGSIAAFRILQALAKSEN